MDQGGNRTECAAERGPDPGRATAALDDGGEATSDVTWARDRDGVALVELRVPGRLQNLLGLRTAADLLRVASELAAARDVVAIVLTSGWPHCFSAGLDLGVLDGFATAHDGSDAARLAQQALERLAELDRPVVAAIDGPCLGAGLELALVARERVATEAAHTRFGHPAVTFGLIPAAGGTQRLSAVMAPALALELLCSGRLLSAREALAGGLVDALATPGELRAVAIDRALALAARRGGRRFAWLGPLAWVGEQRRGANVGADRAFRRARARWEIEAAPRSRAVAAIIDAMIAGFEHGPRAGQEVERRAFGELCASHDVHHRLALGRDAAAVRRAIPWRAGPGAPTPAIGIAGGLAALDIVEASALTAGLATYLVERDPQAGERVRARLEARLAAATAAAGAAGHRTSTLARLRPTPSNSALDALPLVIDCGPGDGLAPIPAAALERLVGSRTVIATGSLTPTVSALAAASEQPSRWVGLRYLPGVGALRIAELTATPATAPAAMALVVEVVERQGFLPVRVSDAPGGCGLRLLTAFIGEALHLVAQGVPIADVDAALLDWGFAVGPLALLDEWGFHPGFFAAQALGRVVGERLAFPAAATRLLDTGRRGRAAGRGLFRYDARGQRRRPDPAIAGILGVRERAMAPRAIVDRCVLRILTEAVACLESGLVASAVEIEVIAVHAVGFPAGRGGPLRYADAVGAQELAERAAMLARDLGDRFVPPRLLVELGASGGRLHRAAASLLEGAGAGDP